jgi:signal transduction histidine kinase
LQNLIANAISYTPREEITIGARDTRRVGDVECFVRDNGAGIQPERLQFVFDKEETDLNKEGGLGLESRYRKDVRRGTLRSGDL